MGFIIKPKKYKVKAYKEICHFEILFSAILQSAEHEGRINLSLEVTDEQFSDKSKRKKRKRAKELFDEYMKEKSHVWKDAKFAGLKHAYVVPDCNYIEIVDENETETDPFFFMFPELHRDNDNGFFDPYDNEEK